MLLAGAAHAEEWKLVWSDEFDYQGQPNPSKWDYEVGTIRNNEPQCYTRNLKNAHVESGCLILEALKGTVLNGEVFNPFKKKKQLDASLIQDYSSASLCTLGKASWLYGKFEIRAKLPSQAGTWPVFWTLGVNRSKVSWPECGEIDIMERMWQRNNDPLSGIITMLHYKKLLRCKQPKIFKITPMPGATTGFHIYTMEWTPDRIDFLMDGILCNTVDLVALDSMTVENPFRKPQYLLLSLALNQRNKGFRDASFPARFEVDYVRVYQKKGAGL
jgi:beta-glucanase (GH16 family)